MSSNVNFDSNNFAGATAQSGSGPATASVINNIFRSRLWARVSYLGESRTAIQWSGSVPHDKLHTLWREHPIDALIVDIRLNDFPELADALIRFAVHGGTRELFVAQPEFWRRAILTDRPGCLGTPDEDWRPDRSRSWRIRSTSEAEPVSGPSFEQIPQQFPSKWLAERLHNWMDQSIVEAIEDALIRMLHDDGLTQSGYTVSPEFFEPMEHVWQAWKQRLDKDPSLRSDFLRVMLTVSSKAKPERNLGAARIRVGPKTLGTCVYHATVFALAIGIATEKSALPQGGEFSNLIFGKEDAHLVGLSLVDKVKIDLKMNSLIWPCGYAFVAGSTKTSIEQNAYRGFHKPERAPLRLRDKFDGQVTIIGCNHDFLVALAGGISALKSYIDKETAASSKRIVDIIEGALLDQGADE